MIEERLKLWAGEKLLAGTIRKKFLPDKLFLAHSTHSLVLRIIKMFTLLCFDWAVSIGIHTFVKVRLVLTPIISTASVQIFALMEMAFVALILFIRTST